MPKRAVVVDYRQCQVEKCEQGICQASQVCPRKILRQEDPYEMPDVYPGLCRGCALCVPACPFKAVQVGG